MLSAGRHTSIKEFGITYECMLGGRREKNGM